MEYMCFAEYDISRGNRSLQSDGKQKQYWTRIYSRPVKLVCFKLIASLVIFLTRFQCSFENNPDF